MTLSSPLETYVPGKKKNSNMIAIASGKGGVGKTWFSITLAHALSCAGLRVLLFDGDLGLANVDIQLGLMPKYTMRDILTYKVTLMQAKQTYHDGGFDILAGQSGSGSVKDIPVPRLQDLMDDLSIVAADYDHVIIDLEAGNERHTKLLAAQASVYLVLSTDEPTALTDAYAFIKSTRSEIPDADIRLVLNMIDFTREGERTYNTLRKACESFLRYSPPLAGVVRRDLKVRDAVRNQASLLNWAPDSDAANDVEALAFKLMKTL